MANLLWRLMPGVCVLCRNRTHRPLDLCAACESDLPRNIDPCPRCAGPSPVPGGICPACELAPPPYEAAVAPFLYRQPLTRLIHGLKRGNGLLEARVLAHLSLRRLPRGTATGHRGPGTPHMAAAGRAGATTRPRCLRHASRARAAWSLTTAASPGSVTPRRSSPSMRRPGDAASGAPSAAGRTSPVPTSPSWTTCSPPAPPPPRSRGRCSTRAPAPYASGPSPAHRPRDCAPSL